MRYDEIVVQAGIHPSPASWVIVPLTIHGFHSLALVLDTGSPVSAISSATADDLRRLNLLDNPVGPPYRHRLSSVTMAQGHPLPDLDVVVLPRLARMLAVGIDVVGLLGLDFLNRFARICYEVDTQSLAFRPRTDAPRTT